MRSPKQALPTRLYLETDQVKKQMSKKGKEALAGVAQWTEHQPEKQRVACLIPSQGTYLGGGPGPQLGVCERQPHIDVSVSFSLPFSKNR